MEYEVKVRQVPLLLRVFLLCNALIGSVKSPRDRYQILTWCNLEAPHLLRGWQVDQTVGIKIIHDTY